MTPRDQLLNLADDIEAEHYERKSGVGTGHCVACREQWPCKPRQLASIYLDVSMAAEPPSLAKDNGGSAS